MSDEQRPGHMAEAVQPKGAVLLLHEFFGLTDSFRRYADRLAENGYTALAFDLYDGRLASSVEEATAFARSLDVDGLTPRLGEAAAHLRADRSLALVGFSMGAGLALHLAQQGTDPDAVVVYYGAGEIDPDRWSHPLLAHWAADDPWEDSEWIEDMVSKARSTGAHVESHTYPGTGHWFANRDVPDAYDDGAAELAWRRTLAFLDARLAGEEPQPT